MPRWHPLGKETYPKSAMENFWVNALWSIIPTIFIGSIFWYIMRAVIRMDRTERKVFARIEAEERAKRAAARAADAHRTA